MAESPRDDDKLATELSLAVVKPAKLVEPIQAVIDMVNVAAVAIGSVNLEAGIAVRTAAMLGGWAFNYRKAERAKATLHAVVDRLEQTRGDYARKDEFADLLEEALRRIAEQPDPGRRDAIRAVLLKIVEQPQEHVINKLFLRLADELPTEASVFLTLVERAGDETWQSPEATWGRLVAETGKTRAELYDIVEYLGNEHLLHSTGIWGLLKPGMEPGAYEFRLTSLGLAFLTYRRG